ncbi:MAG TPA: GNAT family N-acetyltransferase [Anaerolineales bacterium]|nr:GNAT family N-acetyltransferase [Anaerolineales bacterium]
MTAAIMRSAVRSGLRPVDPRRDLAGLADIIEIAFADSLDESGRRMAEEMRRYGRLGWVGWLLGRFFLPPAAYPDGFVWTEQGRIVGNASLMPVPGAPGRWVLANVAVDPGLRRRGIGRALVGACLDLARGRRVVEVVLQVRADNLAALDLYQDFGFVERGTRVTWRLAGPPLWPEGGAPAARPRRPAEWQAQWSLAQRVAPLGLVWPHPLRPAQLRPASWTTTEPWRHWVWPEEGPIQASLTGRIEMPGPDRYFLLVDPGARGAAEAELLACALRPQPRRPAVIECDAGPADETLRHAGLREEHRLTWMRIGLRPMESEASA